MTSALSQLLSLLVIASVGLLIWAALSPFETLGWWAGWFGDKIYEEEPSQSRTGRVLPSTPRAYIIFLSGVGRVGGKTLSYREQDFLSRLSEALPDSVVIDDIFPYSVNNLALTGQPVFARLWRWALRCKLDGPVLAGYLINVRNIFQILISADHRYGPLYNQATAEVIVHGLLRHGYTVGSDVPVYVIGYSGAGQMAVGATRFLAEWVAGPLHVISLGGVFSSDQGLLAMDHLYHLHGDRDRIVRLSMVAPGRWPFVATSAWNRARRQGHVTVVPMGPMGHSGSGGYLDAKSKLPDGTAYVVKTVTVIRDIVNAVALQETTQKS